MEWKKPVLKCYNADEIACEVLALASSVPTFREVYLYNGWNGYSGYAQGKVNIGGAISWRRWHIQCHVSGNSHRFRTPDYYNQLFKYVYPDGHYDSDDYAAWLDY